MHFEVILTRSNNVQDEKNYIVVEGVHRANFRLNVMSLRITVDISWLFLTNKNRCQHILPDFRQVPMAVSFHLQLLGYG